MPRLLSLPTVSSSASRVSAASRMARGSSGALRVAAWALSAAGKGAPAGLCCRPRPAAWASWLSVMAAPGCARPALPGQPCSPLGARRRQPGPATEDAAVEARRGQWGLDERLQPGTYQGGDGEATAPAVCLVPTRTECFAGQGPMLPFQNF